MLTHSFFDSGNPVGPDGIWFTEDNEAQTKFNSPAIDVGLNTENSLLGETSVIRHSRIQGEDRPWAM